MGLVAIDAAGTLRQTFGVVSKGRKPEMKFEPVMWSYAPPLPAGVPDPTGRAAAPVQMATSRPILPTVSWKPWGSDWAVVAANGYGKTVVRKKIYMWIHADESGNITVERVWKHHSGVCVLCG